MLSALCICALIPRLATRTQLVVLVHYREARKPTNTGVLAARCVVDSRVAIIGERDRPVTVPATPRALLLYPSDDAVPLASAIADAPAERWTLIVPDGNWRQAAKIGKRVPGLERARPVTLDDPRTTEYRLRAEPKQGGLATLEAIARALRVLEGAAGEHVEAAMLDVFRVMVSRTLWSRGALRDDELVGGVPVGASRG